jgi:CheY-like chemotaxis protein
MARILVIDDESNIRMMVRLALQHAGHVVETAADGGEGLDKFGDGAAWDVVLLDYRMPGLTGMDVLREMRKRDVHARVIIITAFGTIDLAAEAMREGATDFLRKPFSADTLRDAVSLALGSHDEDEAGGGIEAGINGFRIEGERASPKPAKGDIRWLFSVRGPRGDRRDCAVLLPGFIVDQVRSHAGMEQIPGGDRFWQSLCEEALANYVWQNAEFPPDRLLRVDDLTSSMLRKVDAAISAA